MYRIVASYGGAHGAKDYFDKSLSRGDYYSEKGEIVGKWAGRGAERLGLLGKQIERADFHALCDGKMPGFGGNLTARKNDDEKRIVGFDIVADSVKAFSALWALTKDKNLEIMFQEAFDETMVDIEKKMVVRVRAKADIEAIEAGRAPGFCKEVKCRNKKSGETYFRKEYFRRSNNITYGSFMHFTTRPVADSATGKVFPFPQMHVHGFTFNATYDEHASPRKKGGPKGVWKAGNFADIKRDGNYFNARFQSRLTHKLVKAGYKIERDGKEWTLAGVPESLIEKFSKRTKDIEQEAARLGIVDAKEKEKLGARTRLGKDKGLPFHELYHIWWNEVADDGEKKAMENVAHQLCGAPQKEDPEIAAKQAMDHAIEHSFERQSALPETELATHGLKQAYGAALPEAIDAQLQRKDILREEKNLRTFVTTQNVWEEEKGLLTFVKQSQGTVPRLRSGKYSFMEREDHNGNKWELNDQQKQAVLKMLASNDRVNIIRGAAGTGKSTTLEDFKRACDEKNISVCGFAPTTDATFGLQKKGFHEAVTVQMLLVNPKHQERVRDGVILVDEAGLLSVPQMRQLCDLAKDQNARLLLVGDRRQHASVERGDSLSLLEDYGGVAPVEITQMMRQRSNQTYKDATQAVEEERYADALAFLREEDSVGKILGDSDTASGAFVEMEHRQDALFQKIAEDAVALREKGHSVIVDTPINRNGEIISEKINSLLEAKGLVKKRGTTVDRLRTAGFTKAQRGDATHYQVGQVICVEKNIPSLKRRGFALAIGEGKRKAINGNHWYRQRDLKRGEKLTVVGKQDGDVYVQDRKGTMLLMPLSHRGRFDVYNKAAMKVTGGRRIRFRRGGKTEDGHQIVNGQIYGVDSVTRSGDVRLDNGWVIPKDFGHWTYGEYGTSHMNQGSDAAFVLQDQSAAAFPATNKTQFYVSVTRGKQGVRIYTDRLEALEARVQLSNERMSATELFARRNKHTHIAHMWDRAKSHAAKAATMVVAASDSVKEAALLAQEQALAWAERTRLGIGRRRGLLHQAGQLNVTLGEAAALAPGGVFLAVSGDAETTDPGFSVQDAARAFASAGVSQEGSSTDTSGRPSNFSKEERNQPRPKETAKRPEKDTRTVAERHHIKSKAERPEILSNRWDIRREQEAKQKAANENRTQAELKAALAKMKQKEKQ